ncbi:MAG: PAS domain S-box protein [Bacteroidota bacterium]
MNNIEKSKDEFSPEMLALKLENEALKAQNESLKLCNQIQMILESAGVGIFGIDIKGYHTFVNPKAAFMLGYEIEELIGKHSHTLWHHSYPEGTNFPCTECPIYETLNDGKQHQGEEYFWNKNGIGFYVDYTSMPIVENNTIIGAVITFIDISARKKIEKSLFDSDSMLNEMGRIAKVGAWEFEVDTLNLVWTKEIYDIHEVDSDYKFTVLEELNFYINESKHLLEIAVRRAIQFGESFDLELEFITFKGNHRWVLAVGKALIENGKTKKVFGIFQDITKRKEAELALRDSEVRIRAVTDSALDAIVMMDSEGKISYWNPAAERILGYTSDEAIGQILHKILAPERYHEAYNIAYPHFTKTGEGNIVGKTLEFEAVRKGGTEIQVELSLSGFYNNGWCAVGMIRDITLRKKEEKELVSINEKLKLSKIELEKINSEKDKFFSIIAHDLKNPFNGFLGMTKIMAEDIQELTMEEVQEISREMQEHAKNLYGLLENLLEWARMQRGVTGLSPEDCFLSLLVKQNIDIISAFSEQKEIELINKVPVDLKIKADISMLNTVLRNLISNAIKFTPRDGKVEIGIVEGEVPAIYIKDSGIGMNKDILGKLFKIDQKVSRPGTEGELSTGLGLLLCKEFVEKHGGKIWAESEENLGSTFFFTLQS